MRDRLTFEELGWQGLADYVDYPPTGSSLRDAIDHEAERERDDDGWTLGDHLDAVLIDTGPTWSTPRRPDHEQS